MSVVEFPGLWGLKFTIDRVAFKVFGIPVYWYGIIIAAGFLLAVLLAVRNSAKFGLEPDYIIDMVLYAAPVAIVTSRLYYVIFSWDRFKGNLISILDTRQGGLAIYGAVIGAVAVAYIFAKKKKIGVLKLFDFCMPYFILAQAIGRWGNFINQEAYGTNTRLPWGMTGDVIKRDLLNNIERLESLGISVDPNLPVHPTFLYESLWNLGVFLFLIWFRKRKKLDGEVFSMYMALYGAGRFWIEGLRTDSLMLGNLRVSQVLAALCVIAFAIAIPMRRKKAAEVAEDAETGTSRYGEILKELNEEESAAEDGLGASNAEKSAVADGITPLCDVEEKTLKESDDARKNEAVAGNCIINAENTEG